MSSAGLKLKMVIGRLRWDLLISWSGLYIFRSYPMRRVVPFWVFFPPWSNASAVWAQTKAHQEHSNAASIFFMIASFERAIVCSRANARNAGRCSRPLPGPSRLLRQERSAQRGEFFRRVPLDQVLAAVDEVQIEPG